MALSNNDTGLHHEQEGGIDTYNQGFRIGIIVFLSTAAVVGFLGNGLVVAVILRAKKLKSVMNRFILHLALSDMIVSVLAIPLFLFINFHDGGQSLIVCKIARFFQYLSPEASMTLLITIGWNRHQAVVHPLNIMTYSTANKLIFMAWMYAFVVVAPSLYLTKLQQTPLDPVTNQSLTYCATIPSTTISGLIYVMFLGLVGYIIPLSSLIILYGKIYRTVWRRKSGQLGDSRPVEAFIRSRKKVLKMFLTVIFVFLVTWLPLLLYISAIEWAIKSKLSHVDYVRLITYSLGLCNSICNPFIYALFNKKFRTGCKEMCHMSFKVFQRKKSPVAAKGAALSGQAAEEPQLAVLSRRGGFHRTKEKNGGDKKAQNEKNAPGNSNTTAPVSQLIGRRFRALTQLTSVPDSESTEAVQLVKFRKTADSEEILLHFPPGNVSPQTMNSSSTCLNTDNCVKCVDSCGELDGSSDTPQENRQSTAENGKVVQENKGGYSILKEDISADATKRTRSEGGYARKRTKCGFEETRIRSMPALP